MIAASTRWFAAIVGLVAVVGALVLALSTQAADHADSPDTSQGNLDVNDLYAFVDGDDLILAMTVAPLLTPGEATERAALNPNGIYEFNLDVERDGVAESVIQVVAQGDGPKQTITVLGPTAAPPSATRRILDGSRISGPFGSTFSGGGVQAFVGPRDDPFFINLFGDESLTSVLNAVFGEALGQQIGADEEQTLGFANPGSDDLAGVNTLAIVVSVPRAELANALGIEANGVFYTWATTGERR